MVDGYELIVVYIMSSNIKRLAVACDKSARACESWMTTNAPAGLGSPYVHSIAECTGEKAACDLDLVFLVNREGMLLFALRNSLYEISTKNTDGEHQTLTTLTLLCSDSVFEPSLPA